VCPSVSRMLVKAMYVHCHRVHDHAHEHVLIRGPLKAVLSRLRETMQLCATSAGSVLSS